MAVDPRPREGRDLHCSNEFGILLFKIEHADVRAESGEHVEQRGAGGFKPSESRSRRSLEERGGAEEEGGGRDVSGNGCVDGMEGLRAGDGDRAELRVSVAPKARRAVRRVAGAECSRTMVVRRSGGRRADAGLDWALGRGGVVDGLERAAVKVQRGMAFSKGEARAHGLECLRMRSMGRGERCVADECEAASCGASRPEIMRMVEPELPQSSGRWRV